MDTRSNPSPSVTTAESDLRTRFLQVVERQWPGSTRIRKLIAQHDDWLKKKKTDGRSWYDIITDSLEKNWKGDGSDADKSDIYDPDSTDDAA
jgi:hypothetical protein